MAGLRGERGFSGRYHGTHAPGPPAQGQGAHCRQPLIADNRLLRALRQADLQWSGDLVFKGLSDLGGRRFAIVESLDAMNRMGVTALVATVIPHTELTSHYFATIEEARAWATGPL